MNKRVVAARTKADSLKQFRGLVSDELAKLKNDLLVQSPLEELKKIVKVHVINAERMNIFIGLYAEQIEHIALPQREEALKFIGIMGEVFGEALIPFIPKILILTQKWVKEPQMHIPLSNSIGTMIHYIFKSLTDQSLKVTQLSNTISQFFTFFKNLNRNIQIGISMCLTQVIQNSPIDALTCILDSLTDCLLGLLQNPLVKCTAQILESLISLVLVVEYEFEPYVQRFMPVLIQAMQNEKDWTIRKMAIDVIYTFAASLSHAIENDIEILSSILKKSKADINKNVREAAQEALMKVNGRKRRSSHGSPLNDSKQSNEMKSIFEGSVNASFFKSVPKVDTVEIKEDDSISLKEPKTLEPVNLTEVETSKESPKKYEETLVDKSAIEDDSQLEELPNSLQFDRKESSYNELKRPGSRLSDSSYNLIRLVKVY